MVLSDLSDLEFLTPEEKKYYSEKLKNKDLPPPSWLQVKAYYSIISKDYNISNDSPNKRIRR